MITIVGGIYGEQCMRPSWDEIYGSAGRAATAIARFGGAVTLHGAVDADQQYVMDSRSALEGFSFHATQVPQGLTFQYLHGLSDPLLMGHKGDSLTLSICEEKVLRFGMIEGSAVIDAEYAVYDPQSPINPESFSANGSYAKHLALVVNRHEAGLLVGNKSLSSEALAEAVATQEQADVVVLKMGPLGALVYDRGGFSRVPAFRTRNVWKVGSGDTFAGHFAQAWMAEGLSAPEAAARASKATAYYCDTQGYPTPNQLTRYHAEPLKPSERFLSGFVPQVYLAGPFFSLAQLWMINQARSDLTALGLKVFSPYHDVGLGSAEEVVQKDLDAIHECDLLFAVGDGLDAGTIYEIGYAKALNRPVVLYAENESAENKKMMEGSGCRITNDYVSAIYQTVWEACVL
ncbi:PfkB family carbohydrate kinase [Pseudomonas viridiflava]|uniref:PfkB family carbohydrate kinase n=1 Tax=Pseudomonas viridiflava TaxID=33069 RepID=UPI0017800E2B|nr:PfkB family carbohydrate kinase [Pseudomonas viridiflava]MBD8204779.1 nucleoside 2-deoxyribosyltransferase [Pseudomonas viridiflava]